MWCPLPRCWPATTGSRTTRAGLISVSNGQFHDAPNRPRSPYEQRTLVALSPLIQKVATLNPQFSFPSQLRFTNAAPGITGIEFDAGEGGVPRRGLGLT